MTRRQPNPSGARPDWPRRKHDATQTRQSHARPALQSKIPATSRTMLRQTGLPRPRGAVIQLSRFPTSGLEILPPPSTHALSAAHPATGRPAKETVPDAADEPPPRQCQPIDKPDCCFEAEFECATPPARKAASPRLKSNRSPALALFQPPKEPWP